MRNILFNLYVTKIHKYNEAHNQRKTYNKYYSTLEIEICVASEDDR